jgi:hypothetical protein
LCGGCSLFARHHVITGEPVVFRVDPLTGQITDRDIVRSDPQSPLGAIPHKGEIITLVVNNVFVRMAENLLDRNLLVYAEVYDDGADDPSTAVSKVLFNQPDQAAGVNLGMSDRILYGPAPFKGFPLRIKFYIVQLAKSQKATVSKVIDVAGTLATTAQPQAAPAVGVIVRAAQLINALTKDDFELRFDLTLFPVDQIGQTQIADKDLDAAGEPTNRRDGMTTQVASLRTGSYVIFKRELGERFRNERERSEHLAATLQMDWAQEGFVSKYPSANGGGDVNAQELMRLHGGYLWRVTKSLTDASGAVVNNATVQMSQGPNKDVPTDIGPGYRQMFSDQTYAVISLVPGLPLGVDEQAMRNASKRDAERIVRLLDNPENLSTADRLSDQIETLASALKTQIEVRRISQEAARRVGREPTFRTSTDYPAYWVSQLVPVDELKDAPKQNALARNAAVLSVLSDIVLNLPSLQPDSPQIKALSGFGADDFELVKTKDQEGKEVIRKGVFKLKDLSKLKPPSDGGGAAAKKPAEATN